MRIKKISRAFLATSAACLMLAGGAHTSARTPPSTSIPQKRAAAQKPKGRQSAKPSKAATKETTPRPKVTVIDEAGLKALLDENAAKGRRLLINFWATWCTPCREEFPDLVRIDEEFAGESDFEFITVSLDEPSQVEKLVPEFLSEMKAGAIPAYLVNAIEPENIIALIYKEWRGDLPATFLFGRQGELLFKHTGRVKPDELRAAIKESSKTLTNGK